MSPQRRSIALVWILSLATVAGCKGGGGGPACGNGVVDAAEECDPAVNLTASCADLGFSGGSLLCDPATCTIDDGFCHDCAGDPLTCPDAWTGAHDTVRAQVSGGTWLGQPAPTSALPALAWDDDLATVAASYAAMCLWEHNAARSTEYQALGGSGYVGENLYLAGGFTPSPDDVVINWASEASDYSYASNACAPGEVCGHYTQVAWSTTTAVGCAARLCPTIDVDGDIWTDATLVVCDYAPGGNDGGRPY